MRAVSPEGARQDDLTMRAQIRDAAIRRFPVDGFKGTTVRSVASDVGASPGLVLHHFGSKAGLRSECDEFVIRMMGETKREALRNGSYKDGSAIASTYKLMEPHLRYLAWTLADGGDASARIFDDLLEDAIAQLDEGQRTGLVNQIEDVRSQAAVLVVMQLGGLVLHEHFSRALGVDTLSSDGLLRAAPYTLRLFSGELFNREVLADAAKALEDAQTTNPTKDKE